MKLAIPSLLFKGHQLIMLPNKMLRFDILNNKNLISSCTFYISKEKNLLFIPTKMFIEIEWARGSRSCLG